MTQQYKDLCRAVLDKGQIRKDRTGTGTISIFSYQSIYDMADGFPALTTKDMEKNFEHFKGEMLWMIEGNTNANYLKEKYGFGIWRKWADENGELGRVYGAQWTSFTGLEKADVTKVDLNGNVMYHDFRYNLVAVNQLKFLLNEIKNNPYSRRMLLSAWNPAELDKMALPPCHYAFQLYIDGENMDTLNLKLHQRSCDVFLGVPFNIGEYSLLLHMLAHVTGLKAGLFIHDMTNVHIYLNHIEQVEKQLENEPLPLPKLWLNPEVKSLFDFTMDDIKLVGYQGHEKITGEVSV